MEEIWTPWRMRYIAAPKLAAGCIFCLGDGEKRPDQFILHRGERTFTILNLYPYTVGHLMVIPYRHLPRFSALDREERSEIARCLRQSELILRGELGADRFHAGINLGRAAGAGVDGHLHVHLVPRGLPARWGGPEASHRGEQMAVPVEEVYAQLLPIFASAD